MNSPLTKETNTCKGVSEASPGGAPTPERPEAAGIASGRKRGARPIPIHAARAIAEQYGWDQVVIVAHRVGDDGGEHCTTYGRDKANCAVAARIGDFFKHKLMGWPEKS